jgi:tetratricopeptide (TPR) repeat protein
MTKKILILLLLLPMFVLTELQAKGKESKKGLVQVTTYDKAGQKIHSGYGFFISENGKCLAAYDLFLGAAKAEVIDSKGAKWNVMRIEGASDLYDLVKFTTNCQKSESYTLSDKAATQDAIVSVFMSDGKKGVQLSTSKILECKKYDNLTYYTLASMADNQMAGTPVFDANGMVIGVMQKNAEKVLTKSYAADIAIEKLLSTSALSAGQTALNKIFIPKQLPEDKSQAASYLYLMSKNMQDTTSYLAALSDFKTAYPDQCTAYVEHASLMASKQQYSLAEADYNEAFQAVKDQSEVHYNLSKLIYRLNMYTDYRKYKDWDLNKALSEAVEAYKLSPLPLYQLQQGDCYYALKQYQQAFDTYQILNKTSFASPATFFYAAKARELMDNDSTVVLALLDSAVARFPQPYKVEAAPYLLQRAQLRQKYSQFKASAIDYDAYEKLIGTQNLNDNFFYMKEQADISANLYAWALNDIDKALQIRPKEYLYNVEKAILQLRVGNNDEAIYNAQQALKVNSEGSDAYKVLGIANAQKKNKAEALKYLQKAKELGDTQVDEWIKKLR